jgi:hypothetical protein
MDPVSRPALVRRLRQLGFEGPFAGGNHQYMQRGRHKLILPNPHHGRVIDGRMLAKLLREAGISEDEWNNTR